MSCECRSCTVTGLISSKECVGQGMAGWAPGFKMDKAGNGKFLAKLRSSGSSSCTAIAQKYTEFTFQVKPSQ